MGKLTIKIDKKGVKFGKTNSDGGFLIPSEEYSDEYYRKKEEAKKYCSPSTKPVYKENTRLRQYLEEAKMSRIWQHVEDEKKSFGVISAARGTKDDDRNHIKLKDDVRSLGLGFIEFVGKWEGGTEKSIFVPNIPKADLIKLGMKYNQFSVIYKGDDFQEIGTNKESGEKKVIRKFKSQKGKDNIILTKKMLKDFSSRLAKGPHREKEFKFAA